MIHGGRRRQVDGRTSNVGAGLQTRPSSGLKTLTLRQFLTPTLRWLVFAADH